MFSYKTGLQVLPRDALPFFRQPKERVVKVSFGSKTAMDQIFGVGGVTESPTQIWPLFK